MNAFALMATLGLNTSKYDEGLSKAKSSGSALGKGLATAAKVGLQAVTAATSAVAGFAATSVKVGGDFDKSMSQVAATMGKTMDEMQNEVGSVMLTVNGQTKEFSGTLREFAQEMGRNTAFSATQAADALNYMALAGYDTQTSMNMLPNVLNLAASGNMDLARASDMVTDTQTAFGITLERTTQMVDEMAKAASTGNTSVEQLGDAFLVVGGLAQELNGGMVTLADGTQKPVDGVQELEIALTAMANAGVKGGEAGTHMRNMLLKLADPTDAGATALENMGVSIFDVDGKMRSLSDIFGDLSTQMETMTQEDKIGVISDLFNTRDMASAEALLNAVNQDWDKIGESILDAEGAAQKMADTQLDNLAGDVTIFKSALEGAQIAMSDVLTPALREFVQFGTDGLSQLTSAFQEDGISGAVEVFGGILSDALNLIISKLPEFVEAGLSLLESLVQGLMDNMPMIVESALSILSQLVESLLNNLPMIVDSALQIILSLVEGIAQSLPTLIPAIVDVVLTIVDTIVNNIDTIIDVAIQLIMALVDGVVAATPILIEKFPEIILKIWEAIIRNLPKILQAAVELIMTLIKGIANNYAKVFEVGKQIIDKVKDGFSQKVQDAKNWGRDMIQNFIDGILAKWNDLKASVSNVAQSVKDFLGFSEPDKGPLSNFHTYAPDMMQLFAKGIRDNRGLVTSALESIGDDIMNTNFDISGVIDSNISNGTSLLSSNEFTSVMNNGIIELLKEYLPVIASGNNIYIDKNVLVGSTVSAYNDALGSIYSRGIKR